jgi:hypothetical protein
MNQINPLESTPAASVQRKPQFDQWRDRAAELRAIAETMKTTSARTDLFALAQQWEELADFTERGIPSMRSRLAMAKAESLRRDSQNVPFATTRLRMLAVAEQYEILGQTTEKR